MNSKPSNTCCQGRERRNGSNWNHMKLYVKRYRAYSPVFPGTSSAQWCSLVSHVHQTWTNWKNEQIRLSRAGGPENDNYDANSVWIGIENGPTSATAISHLMHESAPKPGQMNTPTYKQLVLREHRAARRYPVEAHEFLQVPFRCRFT